MAESIDLAIRTATADQDITMRDAGAEPKNAKSEETTEAPTLTGDSTTKPNNWNGEQEEQRPSKNQLKKQRRQQAFEERKKDRKLKDKLKKEEKKKEEARKREEALKARTEAAADGAATGQKRKAGDDGELEVEGEAGMVVGKKQKIKQTQVPITIIIDCGFDELMFDKEIVSLSSQITRSYSDNRMAPIQVQLSITSLNKRLKERMETTLHNHHKNWKRVKFSENDYEVTEEKKSSGDLIYLSSDSDYTLEELEEGKSYIVGGIVDRNRHKGICHKKATEQGIKTAKLPIGEYIRMASRVVLTTNQVVEIMLKWLECRNWQEAFLKVIPQRKAPVARVAAGKVQAEEDEEGDEGEYYEEEVAEADGEETQQTKPESAVDKDEVMRDSGQKDGPDENAEAKTDI